MYLCQKHIFDSKRYVCTFLKFFLFLLFHKEMICHTNLSDCKTNPAVAAKTGTTVTLDCFVNAKLEQLQVQNTSWKMATAGIPGPITSKTAEIKGTSLVIQDVKKNESAWYRCKYMVGQSQQCSETKLTVQGKTLNLGY